MSPQRKADAFFKAFGESIDVKELEKRSAPKRAFLDRGHWAPVWDLLAALPDAESLTKGGGRLERKLDVEAVSVSIFPDLDPSQRSNLQQLLKRLIPWRKGPFSLFGEAVDAEWRSDLKWERVAPHLDDLCGKRVLDVGCGNGYYMYRAAAMEPECVLGLDPSELFFFQFELLQRFLLVPNLRYELLGIQDCDLFRECFDVVLCMGVLYHQRSPVDCLRSLLETLRPGGQLLLESQAIPGEEPNALFPPERYAKARNVFFVPTAACLEAWLLRAGFVDIKRCSVEKTTSLEQRRTELAPFESLEDFLSPNCPEKTIEGHPAPMRAILSARKP